MKVIFPELPQKGSRFSAVDYLIKKGYEFYKMTGKFPKLKPWGNPPPIPFYLFKMNVIDAEKTLGIERKPDFWETIKTWLKNEIEDEMFINSVLKGGELWKSLKNILKTKKN